LSGSGKIFVKGSSQFSDFNGSIPVDEIESIKTSEKTGMFYISLVAAGLAVGYVDLWLVALNGGGFGG
jgi:hypothetical protein